ncbi:Fis family transcriptional regulator [Thalassotalea sp. 1_MG-2023]|uniref:Fis family transcriptional regulator n=1 Tax=Thalassotalea sp. 1_MG-2023 TaxID=3062680 RepID=UPI0026E1ABE9|nr:Fis family transcriptional regulator [Thalassotalea sp. 1_MG-2023]MDO6427925.1 Fis family transcriptional regulator [Thalassotalea sp. 1_MG-2023]
MRKIDKKIENQLRNCLTDVCERALKEITGFMWLTHKVNYANFPQSLQIICVFDTSDNLQAYRGSEQSKSLESLIHTELMNTDIKVKNITKHVSFDTEQWCEAQHGGNWANRLTKQ